MGGQSRVYVLTLILIFDILRIQDIIPHAITQQYASSEKWKHILHMYIYE